MGNCDGWSTFPSPVWAVNERSVIRLDDELRRADYARSILEKGDKLYLERAGDLVETSLNFSSLYLRMLGDPENSRRYFSTQSETRRATELRQQLFNIRAAGELGRSKSDAGLSTISSLLSERILRRWESDDWLSDFPALVINRGPAGPFRELMMLEQNGGDFLVDEVFAEKAGLVALGDAAIGVRVEFFSKQGFLTARSYSTISSALYDLQLQKPQLCTAYFRFSRFWISRSFLEKYSASYRVGDVHLHGQIPIWDDAAKASIRDLEIFPFLKDAFFVNGVFFAVKGDRIVLDKWNLEPLVATAH
jgi:hypothetical protein